MKRAIARFFLVLFVVVGVSSCTTDSYSEVESEVNAKLTNEGDMANDGQDPTPPPPPPPGGD